MNSHRLVGVFGLWLTAILAAACAVIGPTPSVGPSPIALRTQASPGANDICLLARGGGTIVVDPVSGLGVADTSGRVTQVYWRYGYIARPDPDRIALLDVRGRIVARVGDVIGMTGGFGNDDDWYPCQFEPITLLATLAP